MVDQTRSRLALHKRMVEGSQGQSCVDGPGEVPADAAPRPRIEDAGEERESGRQPDVGDIRDPDLVGSHGRELGDEVRVGAQRVPRVSGGDKSSLDLTEQRFLPHHP
jgi:hypothetical protein